MTLLIAMMVMLTTEFVTAQGWYNTNWLYRTPITITNSGGALTDYQVQVSLGTSFAWGHTYNNGTDVHFTTSDGITTIPFYIESWTPSTSASIWVRVPSVSSGTTTIYMYYGNSSATSASNGSATFKFFDDFAQSTLDLTKWTKVGSPVAQIIQDNGSNVLSVQGNINHTDKFATINTSFDNFIFEAKVKMTQDMNNSCTPEISFHYTSDANKYFTMLRGNTVITCGYGDLFMRRYQGGSTKDFPFTCYDYTANVYYKYKISVNGNAIKLYLNDVVIIDQNDNGTTVINGGFSIANYGGVAVYYDDVRVRSYASAEPTSAAGSEQNQYPPLTIGHDQTDILCNGGSNGSIDITVTGGTEPYTFAWTPSNGGIIPEGQADDEDLSGLVAGTYSVNVTAVNGSSGSLSVNITQPAALVPGYSITSPIQCANGTATVLITATGGTTPYTGTGSFQQSIGTTVYPVTDAHSCSSSISVTIDAPAPWYNASWQYRNLINISNPGGTSLTDFQVKVALDGTFDFNKAKTDGGDVRFTSADGVTFISYWIESWNKAVTQATIWVKVPTIPASGTTILMYYGNSQASIASNGTSTFKFFDDFTNAGMVTQGNWIRILNYPWGTAGYTAHDWKYSMEMQQGALYYSINKAQNGWNIESLDTQIQQEFDYIHSQINANGTITGMGGEPQYCYGVALSNLALGYLYFKVSNPTLALRCYNDMILVYGYVRNTYQNVIGLNDAGGSSMALCGFSNAWKAFTSYGNTVSAAEALNIVQNYANTFISNQSGGSWSGANGIQEHEKRDFGVLLAYDVTGNYSYLTAVKNNIDYILSYFWIPSNGGLKWFGSISDPFYECHQQWFMIAVRMLYNKSGGAYNYLAQGQQAWHFLTDNNYANIDVYVHNYVNNGAFFSYRNLSSGGSYNLDAWKGSYEVGTALWGMSLNYDWVSNYQSSHSSQAYNYLDMFVKQIKNWPANKGFFFEGAASLNSNLWSTVGSPTVSIIQDNGNNVLSIKGNLNHNDLITSIDKSIDNFICEAKVKMTADGNELCNPEVDFRYTDLNNRYFAQMRGEAQNDLFLRRYQGGNTYVDNATGFNYTSNIYYQFKIAANADNIKLYIDGNLITNYNDIGTGILSGGISLHNYRSSNPAYFDDVRVRKYASQEPTTSIGYIQLPPLSITFTKTDVSVNGGTDGAIDITVTGGSGSYTYLWSPGNQTTQDLAGIPAGTYSVIVTDGNGCTATQNVVITEPASTSIPVSGGIQYYNSNPSNLNNVKVELYQGASKIYPVTGDPDVVTNVDGEFSFANVSPGTYDVVATTQITAGGINSTDAAQVNIWGIATNPPEIEKVRFFAGDVVTDNTPPILNVLNSGDAGRILQYFVNAGTPTWEIRGLWTFWQAGQTISVNSSTDPLLPSITVVSSPVIQNFYALCTGDFNRSFVPGSMKAGSESLSLIYGETISVIPDMEFDLPLSAGMDMEVGAISLILNFPSDLLEVNGVYLSDDPNTPLLYNVSGDELRIGWNSIEPISLQEGESLLTMKLKVIGLTGEDGIRFKLAGDPLNEIADGDYNVINNAVLSIDVITTSMTGTGEITLSDRLTLANHPNPFMGKTTFAYSLPVDGKVTLEIYDIVGNKVRSLADVTQSAGDYVLSIDDVILQPGVYTATLKLKNSVTIVSRTIKMIKK
jgi:hypothetical protein